MKRVAQAENVSERVRRREGHCRRADDRGVEEQESEDRADERTDVRLETGRRVSALLKFPKSAVPVNADAAAIMMQAAPITTTTAPMAVSAFS